MNDTDSLGVLMGYQLCDALLRGDRVMFDTLMQHAPDLGVTRTVADKLLRPLEIAIREKLDYQVKALIAAGAPLGQNPLYLDDPISAGLLRPFTLAAILGHWHYCAMILDTADPEQQARWLRQDLREAATQGWDTWIDPLLQLGADANGMTQEGNTPLFFAVIGGSTAVIDKLLAAGAQWETKNHAGQTAGDLLRANRPDLAERYGQAQKSTVVNLADRIRRSKSA